MSEKVLVTGGAGMIGSHVVDHCLSLGHEVVVVDDLSGGYRENVNEKAEFMRIDVSDAESVAGLFRLRGPFSTVYHLAAYAAENLSHHIRNYNYRTNVIGSVNLINEAVKSNVKCFVFTSSIAVYGAAQVPMRETMTPKPEDPYGIAKYAVEMDLRAAYEMFGLNYIIFRPFNVYGKRQNIADRYRNVIGIFMNQLLNDKPMTIFGDGEQSRAFTYIDDVAPIIAMAPNNPDAYGKTFNIGADVPYTVNQLTSEVAYALHKPRVVEYLPARKEVLHAFSDHSALNSVFGEATPTPLILGLQAMAKWVLSRGPAVPTSFDKIEVYKNLPNSWRI